MPGRLSPVRPLRGRPNALWDSKIKVGICFRIGFGQVVAIAVQHPQQGGGLAGKTVCVEIVDEIRRAVTGDGDPVTLFEILRTAGVLPEPAACEIHTVFLKMVRHLVGDGIKHGFAIVTENDFFHVSTPFLCARFRT